jgi:4-amino-4-deoxy-L-arabinose transferase-like glycosyltransferase
LLLALAYPLILHGLGSYSIVNGDEAIYHSIARRMVESGNWLRVEFAGEERVYDALTHAPLHFWLKAIALRALGDGLFSMRIVSAALAVLSVLATYGLVEALAGPRAALIAGLVQLTTFQFVHLHSARTGEMEPALALAFTLAAWLFHRALARGGSFVAHHLCLVAIANLKLGLVGVPLLAEAAYFALQRDARPRAWAWLWQGLALAPVGLAWHAYQLASHWDSLPRVMRALHTQTWPEAGGALALLARRAAYYARQLVFGAHPYAPLYPLAIAAVLLGTRERRLRAGWELLGLYLAALLLFFLAIRVRHPWYLMPAIPFLSAFAGGAGARLLERAPPAWGSAGLGLGLALCAFLAVPILDVNPFAGRAVKVDRALAWRGPGGAATAAAVAALAGLLAVALHQLARRRGPAWAAAPLLATLLLVGGVRVAAPLRQLPQQSEIERVWLRVEAARASGRGPAYPIEIREPDRFKVYHYFGDDHQIRAARARQRRQGIRWLLVGPRDPRAAPGTARGIPQ